jgi:class 3 adenylate cyclase
MPPSLPEGTVTFLFTDIKGSTKLREEHGAAMERALARYNALVGGGRSRGRGVR